MTVTRGVGGAVILVAAAAGMFAYVQSGEDRSAPIESIAHRDAVRPTTPTEIDPADLVASHEKSRPPEVERTSFRDRDAARAAAGRGEVELHVRYDDGTPIGGVEVRINPPRDAPPDPRWDALESADRQVRLDENGRAHVKAPPGERIHVLWFGDDAAAHPRFAATTTKKNGIEEVVIPARGWAIEAVDETGRPVEGATFEARTLGAITPRGALARLDVDGRTIVRGFPEGDLRLRLKRIAESMFDASAYVVASASGAHYDPKTGDTVASSDRAPARLVLKRLPEIRGRWVGVDRPEEAGLWTSIELHVAGVAGSCQFRPYTFDDGAFALRVPLDGVRLACDARIMRVKAALVGGRSAARTFGEVARDGPIECDVEFGEIAIVDPSPMRRMRVVDVDDHPITGVRVDYVFAPQRAGADGAFGEGEEPARISDDGKPGEIRFRTSCDPSALRVSADGFADSYVPLPPPDSLTTVRLSRAGRIVVRSVVGETSGRTDDARSRKIRYRLVAPPTPFSRSERWVSEPQYENDGAATFEFSRLETPFAIVASVEAKPTEKKPFDLARIECAPMAAGEERHVTMTVPFREFADLNGRVQFADGAPVADAHVSASVTTKDLVTGKPVRRTLSAHAADDGTFRITAIPTGAADLVCRWEFHDARRSIFLVPGKNAVDVAFADDMWTAEVRCVDEAGEPKVPPRRPTAGLEMRGADPSLPSEYFARPSSDVDGAFAVSIPRGNAAVFTLEIGHSILRAETREGAPPARLVIPKLGSVVCVAAAAPVRRRMSVAIRRTDAPQVSERLPAAIFIDVIPFGDFEAPPMELVPGRYLATVSAVEIAEFNRTGPVPVTEKIPFEVRAGEPTVVRLRL